MNSYMINFLKAIKDYYHLHRRNILIVFFSSILGLILFVSIFLYVDYKDLVRDIFRFSWWRFLVFFAISIFAFIAVTYRWALIVRAYGFKIPFWRLFRYRLAGFTFSYMTPLNEFGGAPFRAYLLTRENVPFNAGLLTIILENFVEVFTQSFIVTFFIAIFLSSLGLSTRALWLLIIAIGAFISLVVFVYYRLRKGNPILTPLFKSLRLKKLHKKIVKPEQYFLEFFTKHKKIFFKTIGVSLLIFIITVGEIWLLLYLMGFNVGIFNTFFAKIILNLANTLPVPAALGVSEWAQTGFFEAILHNKSAGLTFSIIFRAKNIFYSLIGFIFLVYLWQKKIKWNRELLSFIKQKLHVKIT
jgi:uncharacterized protein (TIRG00374 family)